MHFQKYTKNNWPNCRAKPNAYKSLIMGIWSRDNCFDNPLSVLALPRACGIERYQGVVKLESIPSQ